MVNKIRGVYEHDGVRLLTVLEVAELARCTPSNIRQLIRRGRIPEGRKFGAMGEWLFPEPAITEWVKTRRTRPLTRR